VAGVHFFFQAEDGIREFHVTGVQTCALPDLVRLMGLDPARVVGMRVEVEDGVLTERLVLPLTNEAGKVAAIESMIGRRPTVVSEIGRASCRDRVWGSVVAVAVSKDSTEHHVV